MPSLFSSRRHAPPVQPLTRETANPNAATAAASAFLNRDPNMSLSSAAAAAALRARPTTPTNVAEVQSKRAAHRRSPSLSSQTSRERLSHRQVRRTPSVGSMMERTFRSPSPGRSPAPRERNVPPVPNLPQVDRAAANSRISGGRPRAASVQTQPFKTASEKMRDGQHGSWFGGATAGDLRNVRRSEVIAQPAPIAAPEPRPGSVSPSINFSYPRARAHSPSSSFDDQTLVYDPNSRRMITRGELLARSQDVGDFSERPKKKKQEVGRAGSHLSRGTVGRTQAPALEESQVDVPEQRQASAPAESVVPETQADVNTPQETPKKKKKKKKKQANLAAPAPAVGSFRAQDDNEPTRSAPPPPVSHSPDVADESNHTAQDEPDGHPQPPSTVSAVPARSEPRDFVTNGEARKPESKRLGSTRLTRESSASPARSARFATTTEQLLVRHEPPPRSVSPKKSAMKLSNQRDMSPDEEEPETSGRCLSPLQPEESSTARKKSARVSWDDNNTVVVGESVQTHDTETPFVPSPQAKKPWHSIVTKYTKKDSVNLSEDETMSPRPALPLFGSVREKRTKETEERPLVRPSERPASTHVMPETATGQDPGQSSDAAIGTALSQEQASRNAANISKYREPLPPASAVDGINKEAKSAESSDDDLDSDSTEHEEALDSTPSKTIEKHTLEPSDAEPPASQPHDAQPAAPEPTTLSFSTSEPSVSEPETLVQEESDAGSHIGEALPAIAISRPSPGSEDRKNSSSSVEKLPVPGRFPVDNDSPVRETPDFQPFDESSAAAGSDAAQMTHSPEPAALAGGVAMEDIVEEEEETDRCSVYSDAYEDPVDADGDGFLSLDAVVDSPPPSKLSKKSRERVRTPVIEDEEPNQSVLPLTPNRESPRPVSDWENAKAYWRSLSADERRQLEFEALSEASEDEDEDEDEEPTPPKKTKHNKTRSEPFNQPLLDSNERNYQIKPGTKWAGDTSDDSKKRHTMAANQAGARNAGGMKFRQSMRADQPGPTARISGEQGGGMKKSLRGNAPHGLATSNGNIRKPQQPGTQVVTGASAGSAGMRRSMRSSGYDGDVGGTRPSLSQGGRPASYQSSQANKPAKMHKQNLSVEDLRGGIRPSHRRRGSDDSVSSFTRSRATSASVHGFRTSMRSSMPEPAATKGSGRFSLRSMSPPAFRRGSFTSAPGTPSSIGGGRMRSSLRADPVPQSPMARLSPFKRSPGGRKGAKNKSGSRFADSSDEDDAGPSIFSSRFADSSDEEEVPRPRSKGKGMAKSMRGASRPVPTLAQLRQEEERQASGNNDRSSSLHRSGSGRGTLVPLPPPPPDEEIPRPGSRRGSFMSILRRKKDTSGKISRGVGESAARRDTKLERSAEQLGAIRTNGNHQRGPSWPLPDDNEDQDREDEESADELEQPQQHKISVGKTRPSTSGGPVSAIAAKVPFHRRNTSQGNNAGLCNERREDAAAATAEGDAADPADPASPPQPRKKKFGALRKMFGIQD